MLVHTHKHTHTHSTCALHHIVYPEHLHSSEPATDNGTRLRTRTHARCCIEQHPYTHTHARTRQTTLWGGWMARRCEPVAHAHSRTSTLLFRKTRLRARVRACVHAREHRKELQARAGMRARTQNARNKQYIINMRCDVVCACVCVNAPKEHKHNTHKHTHSHKNASTADGEDVC